MTGSELIFKIRKILKDQEDSWVKGEFWSDEEILLCLNAAQDNFVNYCLLSDNGYLLNGLVSATLHEAVTSIPVTTVPSNYLHYISGQIGEDPLSLKTAKVYLGGDGIPFRYSNYNSGVIIINNQLMFIDNGVVGKGVLYYYKRPSVITKTSFQDSFDKYVYMDIIANNAAVIAGIKEIQTQRDYKKSKRVMQELMSNPVKYANYISNNEISTTIAKALNERRQQ